MRGIQKAVNCLNQVRVGTSLPTQGDRMARFLISARMGHPCLCRGIRFICSGQRRRLGHPCICREMFAYLHPDTPHKVDPRIRGEIYTHLNCAHNIMRLTPRSRGILFLLTPAANHARKTPAFAGNILCRGISQFALKEDPRVRGEYT